MADEPTVSVVLCTYDLGDYEHFREAAESVLNQTYDPVELVIVVDGSQPLHEEVTAEFGDREDTVIALNDENVGLLESRNRGVELAGGDVVAFIDDDAVAEPDWLAELVDTYRRRDAIAAGGRMAPRWVAGKPPLPAEFYWLVGVTYRGFPTEETEVRNTFGSNLSFRREVFLELGGFDTDIGGRKGDKNLQGGETELCARMEAAYGEGVWYTPDAVVGHKVFEYRTEPRWWLERAFWQGYSKRAMADLVPGSSGTETAFLGQLLGEFLPTRLRDLLRAPSRRAAVELLTLLALTASVGLGYGYGIWAWSIRG
ncbi:MAG: glucosyl-dolichyl phosphate glucuronosyltransferase [Halodesulfurarchaeum sp.]